MQFWKTVVAAGALTAAAAAGAAVVPVGHAQSARAGAPRDVDVFNFGGGRIGVSVSDVESTTVKNTPVTGVVIDQVEEGSPAEKAGLKKGDVVVEFDGERVRSVRQFTRLVSETPSGRNVAAAVQRDGQRVSVTITPRAPEPFRYFPGEVWRELEELRAAPVRPRTPESPRPAAPLPRPLESLIWRSGNQLGVTVDDLSPQLAEYFNAKEGVLVTSVQSESLASRIGLKAGDVITTVDGSTVYDAAELRRRMQRVEDGEEFTLGVMRDRKSLTLKGKLEAPARRRSTTRSIL